MIKKTSKILLILFVYLILDIAVFYFVPDSLKLLIYNKRSHKLQSYYYHHDQRANANYFDHWGKNKPIIYTNQYGFKDQKKGEVQFSSKNLLFIGDSLAEGVGLKYEDSWVGIISQRLKNNDTTVLNAGLQTYASSVYLAKTYHLIERLKLPITGVYVMISVNDVHDDYYRYKGVDKNFRVRHDDETNRLFINILNFIKGNTFAYQIIAELTPPLAFFQKVKSSFNKIASLFSQKPNITSNKQEPKSLQSADSILQTSKQQDYEIMYKKDVFNNLVKQSIEKTNDYLIRLAQFLKNKNIPLTVLLPKEAPFIIEEPLKENYQYFINELKSLKKYNINFIFLEDYCKGYSDNFQAYRDLFFSGDVHWNKQGNRKIAEELLQKAFKIF